MYTSVPWHQQAGPKADNSGSQCQSLTANITCIHQYSDIKFLSYTEKQKHAVTRMKWLQTGFGLVIGFNRLLQVTIVLLLIHTLCSSLQHVLSLLSPLCRHQSLSDNSINMQKIPQILGSHFMSSLAVPYPTAASGLTSLASNCRTPRLGAISHYLPSLLTAVSRLHRTRSRLFI
jgi:hypothetical protein